MAVPVNPEVIDLGDPDEARFYAAQEAQLTEEELQAEADEEAAFPSLSPEDAQFIEQIILRTILFSEKLATAAASGTDMTLRPYQRDLAYRMLESILLADGDELTGLWSRQSGKSETISIILTGVMVLFPRLAHVYETMERFKRGVWVGVFAPTDEQSGFIYNKVKARLESPGAQAFLADPEIDEEVKGTAKMLRMKGGSFIKRQTANAKANIEGETLHIAIVDEAQDVDDTKYRKSIQPMLASTGGSTVCIGTPGFNKGFFYELIQFNKRRELEHRRAKKSHFQFDWTVVAKYNELYGRFVRGKMASLGEESDEFQMSYAVKWQLDRGMLITEEALDYLGDKTMGIVKHWHKTPCVAGIDVARVTDSTVVTVCWVDWDSSDIAGYREHRVLNWLEIKGTDWETQYHQIVDFLEDYKLAFVGVDGQGMGGPVAERLELMLGDRCQVVKVDSDPKNQSERWKHLIQLIQRKMILYPAHRTAKNNRLWRKFHQQMGDVEKQMKGQYITVAAPDARNAHDDFVDSLAIACFMSEHDVAETVEVSEAPWFAHR